LALWLREQLVEYLLWSWILGGTCPKVFDKQQWWIYQIHRFVGFVLDRRGDVLQEVEGKGKVESMASVVVPIALNLELLEQMVSQGHTT